MTTKMPQNSRSGGVQQSEPSYKPLIRDGNDNDDQVTEHTDSPDIPYKYAYVYKTSDSDGAISQVYVLFRAKDTIFSVNLGAPLSTPILRYNLRRRRPFREQCLNDCETRARQALEQRLGSLCQPFFNRHAVDLGDDLAAHLLHLPVHLALTETRHGTPILKPSDKPGKKRASHKKIRRMVDGLVEELVDLQKVPRFQMAEVEHFRAIKPGEVYQVRIKGTHFLHKRAFSSAFSREVRLLQALASLPLRVPRVEGFLGLQTNCVGVLLTWVQNINLNCIRGLEGVEFSEARCHWYRQISEMVSVLHREGFCWGDVKPDNVLIDRKYDAWLADFGGGWSQEWVSCDLRETEAGDLEGLKICACPCGCQTELAPVNCSVTWNRLSI